VLHTYYNRGLHRLDEDEHEFDLAQTVSPAQAVSLVMAFGRPTRNEVPDAGAQAVEEVAVSPRAVHVHHRTPLGGTNGILRFRDGGIDYVANSPEDSRSWRWEDLQTLASQNPYRLSVFGYLDTYNFDLKEPLDRVTFDRATARLSSVTEGRAASSPEHQVSSNQHELDSAFRKWPVDGCSLFTGRRTERDVI